MEHLQAMAKDVRGDRGLVLNVVAEQAGELAGRCRPPWCRVLLRSAGDQRQAHGWSSLTEGLDLTLPVSRHKDNFHAIAIWVKRDTPVAAFARMRARSVHPHSLRMRLRPYGNTVSAESAKRMISMAN